VLAFIFDIDGTLVDSNELHVDSWDRAFRRFGKQWSRKKCTNPVDAKKKALRIFSGALLCRAEDALVNFNKVRIACADHPLRKHEAVHVNRDPAAIHEHEVRVADQPEMVRPESLDEELFRMPPKTEHFAVTRLELLHVHLRRLIHVRLARARTCARFTPVYVLSATLNVRLSTYLSARLRFCLRFVRLLRGVYLLSFRFRRRRLRFLRLPLRLLRLRCLA